MCGKQALDSAARLSDGSHKYAVHIVRGDATNSAAAQQSKVHFCMAMSTYGSGLVPQNDDAELLARPLADRTRTCFADLQYIPSACTSEILLSTYNRQLRSMGVPEFGQQRQTESDRAPLCIYGVVSDDGPDQKGCAKLVEKLTYADTKTWYVRFKRLLHQVHLIVSKQLKRIPGRNAKNSFGTW